MHDEQHDHADHGVAHGRDALDAPDHVDARELELAPAGSSSSTMNSMIVGMRGRRVRPAAAELQERAASTAVDEREDQRAEVGERQAAEPADRRRPRTTVMISSVSGPLVDMPVSGASRMPASAASEQPSAHEKLETTLGPGARERGELAVVDDRAHRHAEPRAEQQEPQADRERDREHDGDEARAT